jgi:hypothetical protein
MPYSAQFFDDRNPLAPGARANDMSQMFANMNPAMHPKKRLGAKTPPQPPPPFVAVEAKTLNIRTSDR